MYKLDAEVQLIYNDLMLQGFCCVIGSGHISFKSNKYPSNCIINRFEKMGFKFCQPINTRKEIKTFDFMYIGYCKLKIN